MTTFQIEYLIELIKISRKVTAPVRELLTGVAQSICYQKRLFFNALKLFDNLYIYITDLCLKAF